VRRIENFILYFRAFYPNNNSKFFQLSVLHWQTPGVFMFYSYSCVFQTCDPKSDIRNSKQLAALKDNAIFLLRISNKLGKHFPCSLIDLKSHQISGL
jgi:hypothetical protein